MSKFGVNSNFSILESESLFFNLFAVKKTVEKLFDRFYCARKIVTHLDFNYNISFANYQL